MTRSFIAIPFADDMRSEICRVSGCICLSRANIALTKQDAMHLTLRFLGELESGSMDKLRESLRARLSAHGALTLLVRGLGAFPSLNRPSVIWAGVEALRGDLVALQAACEGCAREVGISPENRPYHPHVTLGRVRNPRDASSVARALAPYASASAPMQFGQEFRADNVVLFSSELTRHGPIHRPIEEYRLQ